MTLISPEQAAFFAEQGYVVLGGLVGGAELDRATAEVDRLTSRAPAPAGQVGPHFYWRSPADSPALFGPLAGVDGILAAASELTGQRAVEVAFDQVQVALNIPPYPHRPGRPHLDGYRAGQAEPGTFTLLAGLLLTDQVTDDGGNLWVWPGTHRAHAAHFAEHGPGAFALAAGCPDVELPEPAQIRGRRGDVLLAHYLLGHNIGGNYRGGTVRRALYWRLRAPGHADRWADCLADPWLEFPAAGRGASATAPTSCSDAPLSPASGTPRETRETFPHEASTLVTPCTLLSP